MTRNYHQKKPASTTPLFKRHPEWEICFQQFLASVPSLVTKRQYDHTIRRFFAFIEETTGIKKTPDKVTRQDIESFLLAPAAHGKRKGTPIAPSSRNCYAIIIRSFYSWCSEYQSVFRGRPAPILRGEKPTEGLRLTKVAQAERDMTDEEIIRFFQVIPTTTLVGLRDRALFLCYFWGGRRRKEFIELLWEDLEETTFADGHKGWVYRWQGKGHLSSDDEAELPEPAFIALKQYLTALGKWGKMQPKDPLFPGITATKISDKPIALNHANKQFKRYARLANLSPGCCIHSLRYAFAWERFQANGFNPLAVQQDLRHKDIKDTMRYLNKRIRKNQADTVAPKLYGKWGNL